MGLIERAKRLGDVAWKLPGIGHVIRHDYDRTFRLWAPNRFRGAYATFAEARRSIPEGKRIGYDHERMASFYRNRMLKACESDYAVLFWLGKSWGEISRVFDYGGHVGVAYHGWGRYLDFSKPGLEWLVYDMPAITRVGEQLAAEKQALSLRFTNDPKAGRGCDVFLAAGSLQYESEDVSTVLRGLGELPPHVLLNKMPVHDGQACVTVQSTGHSFHPYRIYNREELIADVTTLGYRLVDDWQNREQRCRVPFTDGDIDIDAYAGYYFVRDAQAGA